MKKCLLTAVLFVVLAGVVNAGTTTVYYSTSCVAFRPYSSDQTYFIGSWGLRATNIVGSNVFLAPVYLPDSANVTEFKAWVFDTHGSLNIQVVLDAVILNEMGPSHLMATVNSSDSSGLQELTDDTIEYNIIDNATYKYSAAVEGLCGDANHRFLGVRIKYEVTTTGTQEPSQTTHIPDRPAIFQNYPNPTSSGTSIRYNISEKGELTLRIYNVTGQLIRTLDEGIRERGQHTILWDGKNDRGERAPSGSYFYQIQTRNHTSSKKLTMLK